MTAPDSHNTDHSQPHQDCVHCPFCGNSDLQVEDMLEQPMPGRWARIRCLTCSARGPGAWLTHDGSAADLWNERVTDATPIRTEGRATIGPEKLTEMFNRPDPVEAEIIRRLGPGYVDIWDGDTTDLPNMGNLGLLAAAAWRIAGLRAVLLRLHQETLANKHMGNHQ